VPLPDGSVADGAEQQGDRDDEEGMVRRIRGSRLRTRNRRDGARGQCRNDESASAESE